MPFSNAAEGLTVAIVAPLKWTQGDRLEIVESVVNASNQAVDVTGQTFDFVVRLNGTIVLAKQSGDGIEITDADEGEVTITISAEETEDLDPRQYDYAFRRTSSGAEATLTKGVLTVEPSAAVPAP